MTDLEIKELIKLETSPYYDTVVDNVQKKLLEQCIHKTNEDILALYYEVEAEKHPTDPDKEV